MARTATATNGATTTVDTATVADMPILDATVAQDGDTTTATVDTSPVEPTASTDGDTASTDTASSTATDGDDTTTASTDATNDDGDTDGDNATGQQQDTATDGQQSGPLFTSWAAMVAAMDGDDGHDTDCWPAKLKAARDGLRANSADVYRDFRATVGDIPTYKRLATHRYAYVGKPLVVLGYTLVRDMSTLTRMELECWRLFCMAVGAYGTGFQPTWRHAARAAGDDSLAGTQWVQQGLDGILDKVSRIMGVKLPGYSGTDAPRTGIKWWRTSAGIVTSAGSTTYLIMR